MKSEAEADIIVAIATYKRKLQLRELLDSLMSQEIESPFGVVVVDNDADRTAESTVALAKLQGLQVTYVSERRRGIAAARNAGVEFARSQARYVAFIDDDEVADRQWLANLHRVISETAAVGVHGPVDYTFDVPVPTWALAGGFFISPDLPEGAMVDYVATNNLILDLVQLSQLQLAWPLFDDEFGLSGGEDSHMSQRVIRAGGTFVWTQSAKVMERVPANRIESPWIRRRAIRTGNGQGHIFMSLRGNSQRVRILVFMKGLARCLIATPQLCGGLILRREAVWGKALRTFLRGVGMMQSSVDIRLLGYGPALD